MPIAPRLDKLACVLDRPPREKEWQSWLWVGLWAVVIFATVPLARGIRDFVNRTWGREMFTYLTLAALVAAGGATFRVLARRRTGLTSYVWLAVVSVIFVGYTFHLREAPEEATHFVQYGLLGVLAYRALSHRLRDFGIYLGAAMIGAVVGILDEAIQWVTPRRFWGLRDIWIDFLGAALVQVGIAGGLRPKIIAGALQPGSIRLLCRLGAVLLVVLGATLLNSPRQIGWYTERVDWLGFLRHNESVMVEYGYRYLDPETGPFRSRFSPEELARLDSQRGRKVARIVDRFRDHSTYGEFLETYTPVTDPFVHEARVHLFRRDRHLEWAQDPQRDQWQHRVHLTVAFRENRILEKYFPTTLSHSSYVLAPERIAVLRENLLPEDELPDYEVESTVSRHLITAIGQHQLVALICAAIVGLALVDRRYGRPGEGRG